MKLNLPKFPYKLFRWFCDPFVFEELQGDLEEAFLENTELLGAKKARQIYLKEVFKMIRPSVIRSLNLIPANIMRLPKNYLKTSIRAIKLNPFYVFANIFGLALAISICTIGYFNYRFNQSFNTHFQEAENVYKINGLRAGESSVGSSAVALAPLLRESGIEAFRHTSRSVAIKEHNYLFSSSVAYADDAFFKRLPLQSLNGSPIEVPKLNEVAISRKLALKLFNESYPVGSILTMVFPDQTEEPFIVKDVFDEPPTNTSFSQSIVTSFDNYLTHYKVSDSDWLKSVDGTFVYSNHSDLNLIANELESLKKVRNASISGFQISNYQLVDLLAWPAIENYLFRGEFRHHLHPSSVWGIAGAALSILLMACFNFINTSIALSGKRLKEIAVRKVMGGNRKSTIAQFMIENTFMITLAVLLSICISAILIPQYNAMFQRELIQLDKVPVVTLFKFSLVLILIVTLLSAAYPSLYVSKFSSLKIFRDRVALSGKNKLMMVLLTFQFALCFYNIFGIFMNVENSYYQENLDRGYDVEQVVNIPINRTEQYRILTDRLSKESNVESVAGTAHLIGFSIEHQYMDQDGKDKPVSMLRIGQNYAETMGLRLDKGSFHSELGDNSDKVIVNSMLERQLGKDMLNKTLIVGDDRFTVTGVVDDFNLRNIMMGNKITPAVIRFAPEESYNYAVVRIAGNKQNIDKQVERIWYEAFPQELYQGFLQEDILLSSRATNGVFIKINFFMAVISILISILGLYTLVSLKVQKRSKEFGVRKVLGASRRTIIHQLGKDLYWIMGIAAVVGLTGGALILSTVFDIIYAYHVSPSTEHFIKAIFVGLVIVIATVGYKVYQTSKINPTEQLRSE